MIGRLDIVPGAHRPHPVRNGAIALAVATLLVVTAFRGSVPLLGGDSGRIARAEFAAANQVDARTPVRVHGVVVGMVQRVEAGQGQRTSVVTMRIADENVTVRRDARAEIGWRNLLGGKMYVDLHPGSPSAPALGDGVIPLARTGSQVEFDDTNQPYDGPTAQAQRDVLRGLRAGLARSESGAGRALDTLGPTLGTIGRGMAPMGGERPGDLRRMVASTARTLDALGRDTGALQGLIDGASRTFAVTAARRRELGALVELTPPALDSTLVTMPRLRADLDHLDPLVARLRPGARALAPAARASTPALEQADALLRESRPLLRGAGPALEHLGDASRSGVPVMTGLRPTLDRLQDRLLPFLRERDEGTRLRNYEAIGPTFSALDDAGGPYNDEGYYLRFLELTSREGGTTFGPRTKRGGR